MKLRLLPALAAAALLSAGPVLAQSLDLPALSPHARVEQTVGVTTIAVDYSSPAIRDRKIFGGLVPFDTLWRTGANGATTIEFSADVTFAGQAVPAGKYAVFTLPGASKWTVILNKNPNQGGTGSYDEKLDQVRVHVDPAAAPKRDRMTFLFSDTTDASTQLDLEWETTRIRVPITVDTPALARANIDRFVSSSSRGLANAARHFADEVKDVDRALALIDASLAVEQTWFNTWLKADFLSRKGNYKAAYPLAEKAHEMGQKNPGGYFYKDRVEAALKDWKGKR
ncbi:MAG: DUF2911 domain-containing protein [Myxococcales bacterium]|nr:DUF2911 domain-containing protein [Myxococcales bacterium]